MVFPGAVGDVACQWIKDGDALAGEANATYHVAAVTPADTGYYQCRVEDESKAVFLTAPVRVLVLPEGSLPVSGMVGLCIVAVACILAGAFVILRRNL